jgi:hypothetical protein
MPPFKAKSVKTTTGRAADKTVADIVAKSKAGKGTLTYTPKAKKK